MAAQSFQNPQPAMRAVYCACGHRLGQRLQSGILAGGILIRPGQHCKCYRCGRTVQLSAMPPVQSGVAADAAVE